MKHLLFISLLSALLLTPHLKAADTYSDDREVTSSSTNNENISNRKQDKQTSKIMEEIKLPQLQFDVNDVSAVISKETIEFHHGKHHQAYVTNLNKLIEGTKFEGKTLEYIICNSTGGIYNNAAQTWNHTFYFEQFGKRSEIKGMLADKIIEQWGSIEAFKKEFNTTASALFGSGWAWLCIDEEGKLVITQESNAGCPLTKGLKPLLTFDVWEHAYYIDYRNRRADYINALWDILNWNVIESRYANQ